MEKYMAASLWIRTLTVLYSNTLLTNSVS
jgi:hypothetical protein